MERRVGVENITRQEMEGRVGEKDAGGAANGREGKGENRQEGKQ